MMANGSEHYKLRERQCSQNRWGVKPTSISLAFFGVLVLVAWYLTNDQSKTSMLLMLAGVSIIVLSFMLFFLSPTRYLRNEVVDAMSVSNTLNVGRMLSSLFIDSKGVYVPGSDARLLSVFIPLSSKPDVDIGTLKPGNDTITESGSGVKGITLSPPGYGLYHYAQKIGATFTQDGLENEIKDVLENGLELATSVNVKQDGALVIVSMRGVADAGLCATVRKEDPRICGQLGCPLCSLVGCMVVSGTGRKARLEGTKVINDTVTVTYELL